MSDCCGPPETKVKTPSSICGRCSEKGHPVQRITLENILHPECVVELLLPEYYFCSTPTCEVVYFSNATEQYFEKTEVRVRVGIKEDKPPIPVCYCFDYTRERMVNEVERSGDSSAFSFITLKVKAGECMCEIKNPSGRCCLGEVKKTVSEAKRFSDNT